ncbi:MAG TPA: peptide chain release factor 1, partial [Desulfobulbaceae bacterium]|nr:peptide chain release factor 1 [Desulfobulbaceae bacterium]
MFERFADLDGRLADVEGRLADPSLVRNQREYQRCAREHAQLSRLHELYQAYQVAVEQTRQAKAILWDDKEEEELRELARTELGESEERMRELEQELRIVLLPKDPNDDKNIFLEIRAGTGGDESALFAGDLFRMYSRFAETMGWRVEVMS